MLYFLVVWSVLLIVGSILGVGLLHLFQIQQFKQMGDRWIVAQWLGLVVLAIALLAVSLVVPLSLLTGFIVTIGFCLLSLKSQRVRAELMALYQQFSRPRLFGGLALLVAIAAIVSKQVTWIDTGLYHYSLIQWLSRFGTVPGVALLFGNFGFTSSWFALAAPFNLAILDSRVTAVMNGFVYLLAVLHLWVSLTHIRQKQAELSDWFITCFWLVTLPLILGYSLTRDILVSASPDLPIILLVGVTAWAVLIAANSKTSPAGSSPTAGLGDRIVPLILAVGAVSIKLVALPLLAVVSLFFAAQAWKPLRLLFGGGVAIALLLPQLLSSTITSGCPLYPSTRICFDLPWSPTLEDAQKIAQHTHSWTSWYRPPAGVNPWLWSFWLWFNEARPNQAMVLLMLISACLSLYLITIALRKQEWRLLWVVAIAAFSLCFLMLTSPFPRFALPYLMLVPALAVAAYFWNRKPGQPAFIQRFLSLGAAQRGAAPMLALFLAALITVINIKNNPAQLLLPPPLQAIDVSQEQVNDVTYWSPPGKELCWGTAIPCAFEVEDVRLRDPEQGIEAGYVRAEE